jgi:hypothetical protein
MSDDKYVIIKRGMYYRPEACGYTPKLTEAGLFTKEQAMERHERVDGVTIRKLSDMLPELDAERHALEAQHKAAMDTIAFIEREALGLR